MTFRTKFHEKGVVRRQRRKGRSISSGGGDKSSGLDKFKSFFEHHVVYFELFEEDQHNLGPSLLVLSFWMDTT